MGDAAIGAAVTGPLAPFGALGGWWVTDRDIVEQGFAGLVGFYFGSRLTLHRAARRLL